MTVAGRSTLLAVAAFLLGPPPASPKVKAPAGVCRADEASVAVDLLV